ncbi:MAG: AAA family ATPase [Candidatus Moranbacteria bacterium]|nr:AAA family ATPase [Candidatus Moranbacteria bacterium]
MRIIEKIEIKNFRSFGNRVQQKTEISNIKDLNIFSGSNDSGKSNILRALNLFFNKRTNLEDFLDFDNDFFKREDPDKHDVKEEMITIRITFWNEKNKNKNAENDFVRLPEKFWVSRKWLKSSEYSFFKQDNGGIATSFKKEKGDQWGKYYEKDKKTGKLKLKQRPQASLSRQLSLFLESIQYHYIPAIKDKNYFAHLFGELQKTLLKEEDSNVNDNKKSFQNAIQESTKDLMEDFKDVVNNDKLNISAAFELPDLINLFKTLNVQTGNVNLQYRGDGIQAKLIPEILNFIAIKELQIKPSKTKNGEKPRKYFIWGFEEPENSYEYKNAQLLAERFQKTFTDNAQIFITTHSFNFISIEGDSTSIYRVWKDEKIESSIITGIKKDLDGNFISEDNKFFNNDDPDRLNEELGIFQLNKDLENLFVQTEKKKKELLKTMKRVKDEINKINKPILISEGRNSNFIKKAKELFNDNYDYEIFEQKEFGDKDIVKLFNFLIKTQNKSPKKFFVLDCDSILDFEKIEKLKTNFLIPYIFDKNSANNLIKKGIENLFDKTLIEENRDKFYFLKKESDDYGSIKKIEEFKKSAFEKFILKRNNKKDFKNFKPLFEKIEELFKIKE